MEEKQNNSESGKKEEKNIIYIGKQQMSIYKIVCKRKLDEEKSVIIKARGKTILRAINLLEIMKRLDKFIDYKIDTSSTNVVSKEDGKTFPISSIDIRINRKGVV